jgi:EmrB/QacA subfamily drug resistance transporter
MAKPRDAEAKRLRWITQVAVTGQLMVVIDIAVVNVATPTIRSALGFSAPGVQWVASAYTLAFAGFLLVGGRAADMIGRRRIFILGLALFTTSSLAAGLAPVAGMLIAARGMQGLGAALLSPATLTILVTDLSGRRRRRAIGAWASMSGVGGGLGVFLGGLMTQELSWRWIFIINVPVGVVVLAAGWAALGKDTATSRIRDLDIPGALTLTAGMLALTYALTRAGISTWTSALTIGSIAGARVMFAVFWRIESRSARLPLVPPGKLRGPVTVPVNLTVLLLFCVVNAPWFLLSYYMQTVLGFGPLRAGFAFLPQAAVIALTSNIGSRIAARRDARVLLTVGPSLAVAGLLLMWWTARGADESYPAAVLGPLILLGLAIGCTLPAATFVAAAAAEPGAAGLASALLNSSRQFGGALGLAILFTTGTQHDGGLHAIPTGYPTAALVGAGIGFLALLSALSMAPIRVAPAAAESPPSLFDMQIFLKYAKSDDQFPGGPAPWTKDRRGALWNCRYHFPIIIRSARAGPGL